MIPDKAERAIAQSLFLARAEELSSKSVVSKIFTAYKNKERQQELLAVREYNKALYQDSGTPFLELD